MGILKRINVWTERSIAESRAWKTSVFLLVGCLFLVPAAHAQDDRERIAPRMPGDDDIITGAERDGPGVIRPDADIPEVEGDREVLLSALKGIVFVTSMGEVVVDGVTGVDGVDARTDDVLATEAFDSVAARYIGQPVSLRSLNELNRDVVSFYARHDYPVVDVVIPEQDITGGVVQLVVIKGRLGQVRTEGNKHFADELLASQIRVPRGGELRQSEVLSNVEWLNRNPFRHVDLVYTPGHDRGETDLILRTRDRFPLRVYGGYEDSGNLQTGFDRWMVGFNWGNVLGLDHQLNYQFTFNQNIDRFMAHSGSYVVPLPWQHEFSVFASHAEIEADPDAFPGAGGLFDLSGRSWQVSTRYMVPLPKFENYSHEVALNYDFKTTNNFLEFGGLEVFDNDVDISQFRLTYSGSRPDDWGRTSLSANLVYSPGGMTSHNKNQYFREFDEFARSNYVYTRLELQRIQRLPYDFSLIGTGTFQLSNRNLLSSEQIGAGGSRSVRGYDDRIVNGDEGVILNLELRSPTFSLAEWMGFNNIRDELQFLVFWDFAHIARVDTLPGQDSSVNISSVGPGLRYSISPNFSLRFDYGFQLKDVSDSTMLTGIDRDISSRAHLGVILSY